MEQVLIKDLRTLALFIELYCAGHHGPAEGGERAKVELKSHNVEEIVGRSVILCESCQKLMAHAWVKRTVCPMAPKPACKHCPNHCYAKGYREKIQEVMRYSGRKMVLGGRIDYLLKLLF